MARDFDTSFDIVALGEAMVEFNQATPGEANYRQGFGGDTSNAVIAASRQGARTAYLTRVGEDAFGGMLLDLWRAEGVDVSAVARDADAPTGLYFVTHGPDGHAFSYLRAGSAASRMQPRTMDLGLIESARWLHVSGISQAISASACDTVFALMTARARARGHSDRRRFGSKLTFTPARRAISIAANTVSQALADIACEIPDTCSQRADSIRLRSIVRGCMRLAAEPARR